MSGHRQRPQQCLFAQSARISACAQGMVNPFPAHWVSGALTGTAVAGASWMIHPTAWNRASIPEKTSAASGPLEGLTLWAEGAQSMRQDERKSLLVLEWDRWLHTQPDPSRPTARDTLKFFCELQDRRSPLLDFRSGGRDKWQIIRTWLQSEGRVSEGVSPTRSSRRRERAASQPRAAQNNKHGGKPRPRRGRRADPTRRD
jgi:hypothetical protein